MITVAKQWNPCIVGCTALVHSWPCAQLAERTVCCDCGWRLLSANRHNRTDARLAGLALSGRVAAFQHDGHHAAGVYECRAGRSSAARAAAHVICELPDTSEWESLCKYRCKCRCKSLCKSQGFVKSMKYMKIHVILGNTHHSGR